MFKQKLGLFMLTVCIFAACNKSSTNLNLPDPNVPKPVPSPISDKQVSSAIQGIIVDETNKPVTGATVKCGTLTATTDANGSFLFDKVTVNEMAAVVTVQKPGYFNGIRTFRIAAPDKLQYVQIQLLPKKALGIFDAVNGGAVSVANAQFTFVAKQVLGADNKPYSGKVSLMYAPVNPERPDFADIMPGDLRAINKNNVIMGLQSFGMMALELQSESGEKLYLDTSKSVTFKMTIPAGLQSLAPATVPLWHFEDSSRVWREDGSATKAGDSYTGTLKYFSTWSPAAPFSVVNFRVTLQDANGTLLSNASLSIKGNSGRYSTGHTNENGVFSGHIVKGETLVLKVSGRCNTAADTRNIGPFTDSTSLGVLRLNIPAAQYIHFSGAVTSCTNTPVKNGAVNIKIDGVDYRCSVTDGTYAIGILRCNTDNTTATIKVIDTAADKTAVITMPVSTTTYVKDLVACED
ncbi:carboxypeptidase-like regulatory domain-containing protein [Chitinophaga sp.]|uniref:carboxypeptidase-like regulatory domain-containing protein n=1 Tax=Chitinophaga sp. TaxID=1869181 RepID=UPI002F957CEE